MNIKQLNEELEKVLNEPITEISVETASKVRDARKAREKELRAEMDRLEDEYCNTKRKADKADTYIHKKNMIPVNQVKDEIAKILRDKPSDPNASRELKKGWGRSKFFNIEFTYNDKAFNWIILVDSKSYEGGGHNIIALRSKEKDEGKISYYHGNTIWYSFHSIVSDNDDLGLWNAALQAVKKYFNVNDDISLNEEIEKVLNEGIKDDINYFFNKGKMAIDDKIDYLFNKYVPTEGMCKTVGGEIIRALCRVVYRWLNDGDMFFKDYGIETCAASAIFLMDNCNQEISNLIIDLSEMDSEDYYTKGLEKLKQQVLKFLDENSKLFKKPNTNDSLKTNVNDYNYTYYYGVSFDVHFLSDDEGFESIQEAIDYAENEIESSYEVMDFSIDKNYLNNPSTDSEVAWITAEVEDSDYDGYDEDDEYTESETKEITATISICATKLNLI